MSLASLEAVGVRPEEPTERKYRHPSLGLFTVTKETTQNGETIVYTVYNECGLRLIKCDSWEAAERSIAAVIGPTLEWREAKERAEALYRQADDVWCREAAFK